MKSFIAGIVTAYVVAGAVYAYKHWPEVKARLVAYHILKG